MVTLYHWSLQPKLNTPLREEMIQPDYKNPSAVHILRGAPQANWRKCHECGSESLHMAAITPWVLCQHCGSQDTRLMREATKQLQESGR